MDKDTCNELAVKTAAEKKSAIAVKTHIRAGGDVPPGSNGDSGGPMG